MTTVRPSIYDRVWRNGVGLVLSLILIGPIRVYQRVISPLTPPSCRYRPCCSAYAARALRVHGPFKGLVLGSWRLVRCNPWSGGGLDPVPSRGRWLPEIHPDGRPRQSRPDTTAPPGTPASTSLPGV